MIDIILPCFKSYETVGKTISSIILQTYKDWRLIIVIDGYDEKLIKIIQASCESLLNKEIVVLNKNSGVANARNVGLSYCVSKYVAFIDSDDIWHPEKLDKQIEAFNSDENVDICGTNYYRFSGNFVYNFHSESKPYYEIIKLSVVKYFNPFCFSSLIFKTDIIGNIRFQNIGHEDYDFIIRVIGSSPNIKLIKLRNNYVAYRLVSNSVSGNVFVSALKSIKVRSRNFGVLIALFTIPMYVLHVLIKRYLKP